MIGRVDRFDIASDVQLVGLFVKVGNGRVRAVIGTEDRLGLLGLVEAIDVGDCIRGLSQQRATKYEPLARLLVRMARGDSSRKSRRVTLLPALRPSSAIRAWETSRVIGMEKRVPSARRRVSRTLHFP